MENVYDRDCPKCGGELEATTGATMDMFPASYPVKCTKCNYITSACLLSEIEMFNDQCAAEGKKSAWEIKK